MNLTFSGFTGAIASRYIPALNSVSASIGLKTLMLAHTVAEGFNPNTVAYKTNNPGNIGTDTSKGIVKAFPTLADGVAAQIKQKNLILERKSAYYKPEMTLVQYLTKYAPPPQNNVANYVNIVIGVFKKQGITITPQTTFAQIAAIGADDKKKSSGSTGANTFFDNMRHFIFGN